MWFVIIVLVVTNILTIIKILYLELESTRLNEKVWIYKTALEIEQTENSLKRKLND